MLNKVIVVKKWSAILFGGLFFILAASRVSACSCAAQTPQMYDDGADIIFTGEVKSIGKSWDKQAYEFKVLKVKKGLKKDTKTITVYALINGAECGTTFEKGQTYQIYAILNEDKKYETNLCMGNQDVFEEEEY
ncbi:MAG: hypothetical protein A2Z88_02770 [Omnitrophica WOR_2 bacterium GWA2_47_8]|nr:MAG: hypothetical protein A2Z88_02770 [Omnitrophica WOR_2 bacterium GWA2_47_8]